MTWKRRGGEKPIHLTPEQIDRFWSLAKTRADGCWEWESTRHRGYGVFGVGGDMFRAHRVAWTLRRGQIEIGLTIDHKCRNRWCINPEHLEAVTNKENILRGESPQAINARKTHCKRGHEFTAENTRVRRGSRECLECVRLLRRKV